jgi:hypothetical protein
MGSVPGGERPAALCRRLLGGPARGLRAWLRAWLLARLRAPLCFRREWRVLLLGAGGQVVTGGGEVIAGGR